MQRIAWENSGLIYRKLQPPSTFLLKTLFTGVFAQSEEKGSVCLKAFADTKNYSKAFVTVFIHGGFIVSGLLPKSLRPKDNNMLVATFCSSRREWLLLFHGEKHWEDVIQ